MKHVTRSNLRFKPMAVAIAAAMCFSVVTPVQAGIIPVVDVALITAVKAGFAGVVTSISTWGGQILAQLRLMMGAADSSAMKVADVINRGQDNVVQRTADMQVQQQQDNIQRGLQQPIDPCANAGGGFAAPGSRNFRPGMAYGGNIGNSYSGYSGSFNTGSVRMNRALDIADGNKPAPSYEVQAMLVQQGACEAYAAGSRADACVASNVGVNSAPKYPNADVKAASIYDGAQSQADLGKISTTFNAEQISAAKAYLRNVTTPYTLRELTKLEAQTDAGRQYLALRDAHIARIDLAKRPSNEWLSNVSPYRPNIDIIKAMQEGQGAAAQYIRDHINDYAPKGKSWDEEGISNHAMMDIEANRRSNNPAWIKELAMASDPLTLQREQLVVSAQTNFLLTKLVLESEKERSLLGAIYQSTTDRDAMPDLIAQHRRATQAR